MHTLQLNIPPFTPQIAYTDNILLIGSCFTENMADRLIQHKFKVLSNPHGILFNPLSVASSLANYMDNKQYHQDELFYLNELWNSWQHHTRFSHTDTGEALKGINQSQHEAAGFIKQADWVVITLGSAFQYYLRETGKPVANNHRAPAQWFDKRLLGIDEIVTALSASLRKLQQINPKAHIIFTISPVRHIRDGVIDNNRSKARLLEAVHTLCEQFSNAHYFPAYELVIDILRDYRYYDIDLVHPNYLATSYVWEQFTNSFIAPGTRTTMQQVQEIMTARNHKTRFPGTEAHRKFKAAHADKIQHLMKSYPYLDLAEELNYFTGNDSL